MACEAAAAAPPAVEETRGAADKRAALVAWHARMSDVPDWVDWEQLQRGQEVFIVFAPAAALSLYYLSLVGGFSAPLITRVLRATAYLTAPPKQVSLPPVLPPSVRPCLACRPSLKEQRCHPTETGDASTR